MWVSFLLAILLITGHSSCQRADDVPPEIETDKLSPPSDVAENACSCSGSIAGAVIISAIVTLVIVALIWCFCENKRRPGLRKRDPEAATKSCYDNPQFVGDDFDESTGNNQNKLWQTKGITPQSTKMASTATNTTSTLERGKLTIEKVMAAVISGGKAMSPKRTKDDSSIEPRQIAVPLRGHDFTGLGFTINGSLRDGIYVKEIMNRGPANESKQMTTGDRVIALTVLMEHMVFEDALTILSYASAYPVLLHLQKNQGTSQIPFVSATPPKGKNNLSTISSAHLSHPLYRSQSQGDLKKISASDIKKLQLGNIVSPKSKGILPMDATVDQTKFQFDQFTNRLAQDRHSERAIDVPGAEVKTKHSNKELKLGIGGELTNVQVHHPKSPAVVIDMPDEVSTSAACIEAKETDIREIISQGKAKIDPKIKFGIKVFPDKAIRKNVNNDADLEAGTEVPKVEVVKLPTLHIKKEEDTKVKNFDAGKLPYLDDANKDLVSKVSRKGNDEIDGNEKISFDIPTKEIFINRKIIEDVNTTLKEKAVIDIDSPNTDTQVNIPRLDIDYQDVKAINLETKSIPNNDTSNKEKKDKKSWKFEFNPQEFSLPSFNLKKKDSEKSKHEMEDQNSKEGPNLQENINVEVKAPTVTSEKEGSDSLHIENNTPKDYDREKDKKSWKFDLHTPEFSLPSFHLKRKNSENDKQEGKNEKTDKLKSKRENLEINSLETDADATLPKLDENHQAEDSADLKGKIPLHNKNEKEKKDKKHWKFDLHAPDFSLPTFHIKRKDSNKGKQEEEKENTEGRTSNEDIKVDFETPKMANDAIQPTIDAQEKRDAPISLENKISLEDSNIEKERNDEKHWKLDLHTSDFFLPSFHLKKKDSNKNEENDKDAVDKDPLKKPISLDVKESKVTADIKPPILELDHLVKGLNEKGSTECDDEEKEKKSKAHWKTEFTLPKFSFEKKTLYEETGKKENKQLENKSSNIEIDASKIDPELGTKEKVADSIALDENTQAKADDHEKEKKNKHWKLDFHAPGFHLKKKDSNKVKHESKEYIKKSSPTEGIELNVEKGSVSADLNLPVLKTDNNENNSGDIDESIASEGENYEKEKKDKKHWKFNLHTPEFSLPNFHVKRKDSEKKNYKVKNEDIDAESPVLTADMNVPTLEVDSLPKESLRLEGNISSDVRTDVNLPKLDVDLTTNLSENNKQQCKLDLTSPELSSQDFNLKKKDVDKDINLMKNEKHINLDQDIIKTSHISDADHQTEGSVELEEDNKEKLKKDKKVSKFGLHIAEFSLPNISIKKNESEKIKNEIEESQHKSKKDNNNELSTTMISMDINSPSFEVKQHKEDSIHVKNIHSTVDDTLETGKMECILDLPDLNVLKEEDTSETVNLETELPTLSIDHHSETSQEVEVQIKVENDDHEKNKKSKKNWKFDLHGPEFSLPSFYLKKKDSEISRPEIEEVGIHNVDTHAHRPTIEKSLSEMDGDNFPVTIVNEKDKKERKTFKIDFHSPQFSMPSIQLKNAELKTNKNHIIEKENTSEVILSSLESKDDVKVTDFAFSGVTERNDEMVLELEKPQLVLNTTSDAKIEKEEEFCKKEDSVNKITKENTSEKLTFDFELPDVSALKAKFSGLEGNDKKQDSDNGDINKYQENESNKKGKKKKGFVFKIKTPGIDIPDFRSSKGHKQHNSEDDSESIFAKNQENIDKTIEEKCKDNLDKSKDSTEDDVHEDSIIGSERKRKKHFGFNLKMPDIGLPDFKYKSGDTDSEASSPLGELHLDKGASKFENHSVGDLDFIAENENNENTAKHRIHSEVESEQTISLPENSSTDSVVLGIDRLTFKHPDIEIKRDEPSNDESAFIDREEELNATDSTKKKIFGIKLNQPVVTQPPFQISVPDVLEEIQTERNQSDEMKSLNLKIKTNIPNPDMSSENYSSLSSTSSEKTVQENVFVHKDESSGISISVPNIILKDFPAKKLEMESDEWKLKEKNCSLKINAENGSLEDLNPSAELESCDSDITKEILAIMMAPPNIQLEHQREHLNETSDILTDTHEQEISRINEIDMNPALDNTLVEAEINKEDSFQVNFEKDPKEPLDILKSTNSSEIDISLQDKENIKKKSTNITSAKLMDYSSDSDLEDKKMNTQKQKDIKLVHKTIHVEKIDNEEENIRLKGPTLHLKGFSKSSDSEDAESENRISNDKGKGKKKLTGKMSIGLKGFMRTSDSEDENINRRVSEVPMEDDSEKTSLKYKNFGFGFRSKHKSSDSEDNIEEYESQKITKVKSSIDEPKSRLKTFSFSSKASSKDSKSESEVGDEEKAIEDPKIKHKYGLGFGFRKHSAKTTSDSDGGEQDEDKVSSNTKGSHEKAKENKGKSLKLGFKGLKNLKGKIQTEFQKMRHDASSDDEIDSKFEEGFIHGEKRKKISQKKDKGTKIKKTEKETMENFEDVEAVVTSAGQAAKENRQRKKKRSSSISTSSSSSDSSSDENEDKKKDTITKPIPTGVVEVKVPSFEANTEVTEHITATQRELKVFAPESYEKYEKPVLLSVESGLKEDSLTFNNKKDDESERSNPKTIGDLKELTSQQLNPHLFDVNEVMEKLTIERNINQPLLLEEMTQMNTDTEEASSASESDMEKHSKINTLILRSDASINVNIPGKQKIITDSDELKRKAASLGDLSSIQEGINTGILLERAVSLDLNTMPVAASNLHVRRLRLPDSSATSIDEADEAIALPSPKKFENNTGLKAASRWGTLEDALLLERSGFSYDPIDTTDSEAVSPQSPNLEGAPISNIEISGDKGSSVTALSSGRGSWNESFDDDNPPALPNSPVPKGTTTITVNDLNTSLYANQNISDASIVIIPSEESISNMISNVNIEGTPQIDSNKQISKNLINKTYDIDFYNPPDAENIDVTRSPKLVMDDNWPTKFGDREDKGVTITMVTAENHLLSKNIEPPPVPPKPRTVQSFLTSEPVVYDDAIETQLITVNHDIINENGDFQRETSDHNMSDEYITPDSSPQKSMTQITLDGESLSGYTVTEGPFSRTVIVSNPVSSNPVSIVQNEVEETEQE